jgi:hypothetical protein
MGSFRIKKNLFYFGKSSTRNGKINVNIKRNNDNAFYKIFTSSFDKFDFTHISNEM